MELYYQLRCTALLYKLRFFTSDTISFRRNKSEALYSMQGRFEGLMWKLQCQLRFEVHITAEKGLVQVLFSKPYASFECSQLKLVDSWQHSEVDRSLFAWWRRQLLHFKVLHSCMATIGKPHNIQLPSQLCLRQDGRCEQRCPDEYAFLISPITLLPQPDI